MNSYDAVAPYVDQAMSLIASEISEGEYTAQQARAGLDDARGDIAESVHEIVGVPWG